jgi:CheY-like chemotaxis protein
VLLDLHLPDVPGEEVPRLLKADPETAGIPVIVLSANTSKDALRRLVYLGAADCLTKPVDVERLLAVVGDVIGATLPGSVAPG